MTIPIPKRSLTGCLTCKRRKKKCDEKRPQCDRCFLGEFECLGYAHLEGPSSPPSNESVQMDNKAVPLGTNMPGSSSINSQWPAGITRLPDDSCPTLAYFMNRHTQSNSLSLAQAHKRPSSIPRSPQLGQFERDTMVDLIVSQHGRIADRTPFRPYRFSLTEVLVARARSSEIILTTMYIGARIVQALLDHTNWHDYVGWIENFRRQISRTESNAVELNVTHLRDCLSAIEDLSFFVFMILNSSSGHLLLRKGVPHFLQLAAQYPQMWTQNSAISISHALNPTRHEMAKFALFDTISALAFGTAPLLNYDTAIHEDELENGMNGFLERVYSCPVVILVLLARINSARMARLMTQKSPTPKDIRDIESCVRNWNPIVDYTEKPAELVARLAVQECWRQAALVYAYMGMCGVNSVDERVQHLVLQIAQLAGIIEADNPLDAHLSIPCLIAGVAARKEKHRTIFRRKLVSSQNIGVRVLRGADFVPVLDHLWHGAAAGGSPVTWEDYVNSRYATMPLDM